MKNNNSGLGFLLALALALGAAFGWSAIASSPGYLPTVGPTPLRFQSDRNLPLRELPPLAMQNNTASDVTSFPTNVANPESVIYTAASHTNAPPQYFWPFPSWYWPSPDWSNPPPQGEEIPRPPVEPAPTNTVYTPHTASDLLVVTPQMLVDYLKQSQSETNTVSPSAQAPVEFTPANPSPAPASSAHLNSP
jgi:hypothetical protein